MPCTINEPLYCPNLKGSKKAGLAAFLYSQGFHLFPCMCCREQLDTWNIVARARNEGRLFSRIEWPKDPEIVRSSVLI